jgi:hypothetical protein
LTERKTTSGRRIRKETWKGSEELAVRLVGHAGCCLPLADLDGVGSEQLLAGENGSF